MELLKRLSGLAQSAGDADRFLNFGPPASFLSTCFKSFRKSPAFKPTRAATKVYQVVVGDKVALIERLPSKYRDVAKELVWKSVMRGYDDAGLARELHQQLGLAPERAHSIASVQCKMARSVIENAQMIELGIGEAIWRHDKVRCAIPGHRALDGKSYPLARGANSEGKRHWPSGDPACYCTSVTANAPTGDK